MQFEFLNEYIEQHSKYTEKSRELGEKEQAALQELQALKLEYERVITDSLSTGKDATKKLGELEDKVETAERLYQRCQHQRQLFPTIDRGITITAAEVAKKFNGEFRSAYAEQVIGPILERLLAAKKEIAAASIAYGKAIRDFENERVSVVLQIGESSDRRVFGVDNLGIDRREKYFITDRDVRFLRLGEPLPGIELEKEEK